MLQRKPIKILIYINNLFIISSQFVIKLSSIWASLVCNSIKGFYVSMDKTPHPKKEEKKDFAFGISLKEFIVSILLGVSSGLATAASSVRNLFHDDIKNATAFETHFDGRQARLDAIELKDYKSPSAYWKANIAEKNALNNELNDLAFKYRGVRKDVVFGTIDRFKTLSPRSRGQLYFNGAVGAAIGAAMTLSFFNGVATRDKIDKISNATGADREVS